VLLRPHPANSRQWRAFDAAAFGNVAIWPPIGTDPNAPGFRADYFDSLYYSAGVVGINTSAQLEAGIVGRPVFTIRAAEFAHAQEGTLHFGHLVETGRALVHDAATIDEHVGQLSAALADPAADAAATREFVRWFIRPFGLDVAATPKFAEAIDALARLPRPAAAHDGLLVAALRPVAFMAAGVARSLAEDRPLWVYPLRPVLTMAIHAWALVFHARERGRQLARGLRRTRRRAQAGWYESSQEVGKRLRRVRKKLYTR
jgi:hypothetical protein